tara:strand:+ start:1329 stop:1673 length:345 start_codon:yes stop_codon:yes gene_type:complete
MKKLALMVLFGSALMASSTTVMAESYETIKKNCHKYTSDPAQCIDQNVGFAFKDLEDQIKMLKLKQQLNIGKDPFRTEVLILKTEAKEQLENGESADIVLGELITKLNRIIETY